ncbi:DNA polymerase III subunit delta [Woodsholea maritima]|uniref:DNA polymerase III subunit delta n=1 Tax=Woodsholea maritima TaxID=240237 RepID=UPI0003747F42|nr:DNA polymerase III subunit delta [Woodsholea maritima]
MAKLRAQDIPARIKNPDPKTKIYLIYGPDLGLVRERATELCHHLVSDIDDPFSVSRLSEEDIKADPAALPDAMAALSMMGTARLVRLRLHGDSAPVASFISEVEAGTAPVEASLVIESGDLKKTAKLRKIVEDGKISLVLPCYAESLRDLLKLAEDHFKAEGLSLDPDARQALGPVLEGDHRLALGEIEKLILYKGLASQRSGPDTITRADIAAVSAIGAEAALDQALEPALLGQLAKADRGYARAIEAGISPVAILRVLQRKIDQFAIFHDQGGNDMALTKAGAPRFGPPADQFRQAATRWKGRRLDHARHLAFEAERDIKRSGAPAEALVGALLIRLARGAAQAGR